MMWDGTPRAEKLNPSPCPDRPQVRHGDAQAENRQPNLANPSRERFQTLEDKVEKLEVGAGEPDNLLAARVWNRFRPATSLRCPY